MLTCSCVILGIKFQSPCTEYPYLISPPLLSSGHLNPFVSLPVFSRSFCFIPPPFQIPPRIAEVENIQCPVHVPAMFVSKYFFSCISNCCIVGRRKMQGSRTSLNRPVRARFRTRFNLFLLFCGLTLQQNICW